jgi:uncharacterized protein YukE
MSDNKLVDDSSYRERYTVEGFADDPSSMYVTDMGRPTGPDDKGWAAGVPLWEAYIDSRAGIREKDSLLASLNSGALGLEALGMIFDPIGAAVSSLVGWILEHLRPFRDLLDLMAGYPDLIKDVATSWANIAAHLGDAHTSFAAQVNPGTSEWQGEAADAYRSTARGVVRLLDNGSAAADVLNKLTTAAGEAVAGVRQFIRDIVAETVAVVVDLWLTRGATATAAISRTLLRLYRVTANALEALNNVITAISLAYDTVKMLIETSVKAWRGYRDGSEPSTDETAHPD